jgi:hypothetical protein
MHCNTFMPLVCLMTAAAGADGVLSWGDVEIVGETANVQLFWQADQSLAGFQFTCTWDDFLDAYGGEVEALKWSIYHQDNTVLAFTMDPATVILPQDSPLHLISVQVPLSMGTLMLVDKVFSDPAAQEIQVSGPGPLVLDSTCPADVTGDGHVDVDDVLMVLSFWDSGDGGDATGDGVTDVNDILAVIAAWGLC